MLDDLEQGFMTRDDKLAIWKVTKDSQNNQVDQEGKDRYKIAIEIRNRKWEIYNTFGVKKKAAGAPPINQKLRKVVNQSLREYDSTKSLE